MRENEEGLVISYGPQGGDCTGPYYITLTREMTVKEFIEKQLKDLREWGYFEIRNSYNHHLATISYSKGKLDDKTLFTIPYGDEVIKRCGGSGGWSRSDFILTI